MSFLTVHMADALMKIVNLIPVQVRATGYSQKLPSLKPIPVKGYDLVDTEILFETRRPGAHHHRLGVAEHRRVHHRPVQPHHLLGRPD